MITFGDLIANGVLAIGDGYRAKNEELGDHGPIFLRAGYLQDSGWVLNTPDRLSNEPQGGFGTKIARPGDTVLTTKGNSLGRMGFIDDRVAGSIYSPHLSYWRSLEKNTLHPRFLYYWAHSAGARRQIRARSYSTDMAPYLSLADQLTLQIDLPPIRIQQDVADFLRALDDKIDLNRRMAQTLEAMARALFKSWFVDFDPVHAKAEGRPTGLPDDLAALLPDSFDKNGFPTEWGGKARAIGALVRSTIDPTAIDPKTPYVGLEHMARQQLLLTDSGLAQDVDSAKASFLEGDLLFGKLRPYFHKVAIAPRSGICSSDIFVFRPTKGIPAPFLYLSFSQSSFVESASAASSGTRMPRADWAYMQQLPMALPPPELLSHFDQTVWPLTETMLARAAQSRTLAALRDTLLPKLISGELRIPDAEQRIAAA